MASAPRPPVTRSRTAAGDIFTASDPTGPTLRFPNQPGGPRTGAPPGLREDVQMSQDAVDDLVKLLDLEPIELNIFRGISPDEDRQRVFGGQRSEEHTSELQSLMRISYAVFCLKKKTQEQTQLRLPQTHSSTRHN